LHLHVRAVSFRDFLCWLLRTSVQKIGILCTIEQACLPKHVRCEYNQRGLFCSYSLAMRLFHEGEGQFVPCVFISIKQRVCFSFHVIQQRFSRWIKPSTTSLLLGTFADVIRGKSELLAENALLRQQLIILRRQIKRPTYMSFILIHGAFLSDNLRILA